MSGAPRLGYPSRVTLTVAQAGRNGLLGLTLTGTPGFVPTVGGVGILSIVVPWSLALRGLALDIQRPAFDTSVGCGVTGPDRAPPSSAVG